MKFTLRDFLNVIFRYSGIVIAFCVAVLIAALVFTTQSGKLYDSKAKILVSLGTEALGKADYLSGRNRLVAQRDQQIQNEQQILESHEVMLTAAKWILQEPATSSPQQVGDDQIRQARRFLTGEEPPPTFLLRLIAGVKQMFSGLFAEPEDRRPSKEEQLSRTLEAGFTVTPVLNSDSLDLAYRARDPRVAQTVLQLIIDSYLKHHIAVFGSSEEASLLKSQLDQSLNQYHNRLGEMSAFMNTHRVYNDDAQVNLLIEQRQRSRQALNEAMAAQKASAARLASLNSIQSMLHDYERYSTTEIRNKEREALLSKLDDAEIEERTLLTRHPKGSRADQDQQAKLSEIRQLIQAEPEQVVQETEQRKTKASEFVESELVSAKENDHADQARIASLEYDLRNIDRELGRYATDLKSFDALKLDVTFARQESEQMAQVYQDNRLKILTAQSSITDISIIDAPTWDPKPASPRSKLVVAGTLALLVLGSFAVLLAAMNLDTTVADRSAAESSLGLPVVSTIPIVRGGEGRDFAEIFSHANNREFAQMYGSVRDRPGGEGEAKGKVVLVAESRSREGASLVGYGFAKFLSHYAHEKTAFLDRTEHTVGEPGEVAVLEWPAEGMNAGSPGVGQRALESLNRLRGEYAYVVVAAGAVREATDLLEIGGIVSAAFFVIEAGKTRRAAARYNLDLLEKYGFRGINLVLNKRVFYIPGWLMRFV